MGTEIIDPRTGKKRIICGANKKNGGICMARPRPNGKCRFHGGNAPWGHNHPHYKHGRYSKYLPRNLLTKYMEAQEDEDLYSLRPEIAILEARTSSLFEQLTEADGGKFISNIEHTLLTLQGYMFADEEDRDDENLREISNKLSSVLSEAKNERRRWQEVYDVIDHRRKLVESDRKRELEAQRYITEKQAQLLMSVVISVIRNNIEDQNVLTRISAELSQLSVIQISREPGE